MEESPSRCLLRGLLGSLGLRGSVGSWRPVACQDSEALFQNVSGLCLHFEGLSRELSVLRQAVHWGQGDLAGQDVNICLCYIVGVLVLLSMVGALKKDS